MAKRLSFDHVTTEAETDQGLSIRNTILFHAFNERGVIKEQRRIDDAVRALVDAGKAKPGALLAYGSLDHTMHDLMMALASTKSDPARARVSGTVSTYRHRNQQARTWVESLGGVVAEPTIKTIAEVRAAREALINELAGEG